MKGEPTGGIRVYGLQTTTLTFENADEVQINFLAMQAVYVYFCSGKTTKKYVRDCFFVLRIIWRCDRTTGRLL